MKQIYIVADNAFRISVDENLPAWQRLKPRFSPFAVADGSAETALTVDITTGAIAEALPGERIYEPTHNDIGFVHGSTYRTSDGSLAIDFHHADDPRIRLRMHLSVALDHADITLNTGGDDNDFYFLSHALMLAYVMATASNGTLMIHASAVLYHSRAYLFQGKSGTGKSTHARLWTENVLGAELLNDDNPLIRFSPDGIPTAYGSPWSGKTDCYRNIEAPLGAIVRLHRSQDNELRPITNPLKAYASLTSSMFFLPIFNERQREARHQAIERLVRSVACCEMYCRPDADAALVCLNALRTLS